MKLSKADKKRLKKEQRVNNYSKTPVTEDINEQVIIKNKTDLLTFFLNNLPFIGLLILLGSSAYFYSLFGEFVTADDVAGFVNNALVRDFWGSIKTLKIQESILATSYALFKVNPFPLHIYSLIVHLTNVVLLFAISYMLFGKQVSAVSSILFAVHPVTVESVSWLGGLNYLHLGLFFFLTLITYLLYKNSGNRKYLYLSVGIYIVSLILQRYAWQLTFPFLIIIVDQLILQKRINLKSLTALLPFILAGGGFFLIYIRQLAQTRIYNLETLYSFDAQGATPWLNRVPYTFYKLILLLLFPKTLSIFHEGEVITTGLYNLMIIITVSFLIGVIVLYKRYRIYSGLLLAIVASVSPTLAPVQVAFFIAERYLYIGTAFFSLFLALIIYNIQKKTGLKNTALYLTLIITSLYFIRTVIRTTDWHNSKNLWLSTSKVAVNSARVYNNLGDAYATEGNYAKSIESFQKAMQLQPGYTDVMHNIALSYLKVGQYDKAREYLEMALKTNPNYAGAETAKKIITTINQIPK